MRERASSSLQLSYKTGPLNFCFCNIHGQTSKTIENKFNDVDFLQKVENSHIVGLAELHTVSAANLTGFERITHKIREKAHKGPKIDGGLSVFVKPEASHMVEAAPNNNKDCIWIKIKREKTGEDQDIYLGTVYLSPEKTNDDRNDSLIEIFDEATNFKAKGIVLLQGDFNAHTSNKADFLVPDKTDEIFGIENCKKPLLRNSEDRKSLNKRGSCLLDLCKSHDFLIANGRKPGDIFGKYTSFQWNGCRVVDYLLSTYSNFEQITKFQVGDFCPWLSDHCPLYYSISLTKEISKIHIKDEPSRECPPKLMWDKSSKTKFEEVLKSEHTRIFFEGLSENNEISAAILTSQLTEKILHCAEECGIKTSKKKGKGKTASSPWYDKECSKLKNDLTFLAKCLKHSPNNQVIREQVYVAKRKYQSKCKTKKNAYKLSIMEELHLCGKGDPRKFWKLLNKLSPNHSNSLSSNNIKISQWTNHFKSILNSKRDVEVPTSGVETDPLDYVITMEELAVATAILKNGKCPGLDNIINEMLICIFKTYPHVILSLFNRIFETETAIHSWYTAIIVPIFKKGDPNNPDNYRGISLLSCLSKLFYTVLNNRLLKFCRDNDILSPSQLGFMPGNRTSDAHLILYNLIRKYCHVNGKKLYGCFIDFSKAFDTVPRDILFKKLIAYQITGKFLKALHNLYNNDNVCIKKGDRISDAFGINQGVRQGCVLSPLLFNIFIADLPRQISTGSKVVIQGDQKINCLLWADDLIILCESEQDLQSLLNNLDTYCTKNELTINHDKSKCMIFNKTGRLLRNVFYLGVTKLENVRSYKYLGLVITPSGEIQSALEDLRSRGLKAYWCFKKKMGIGFNTHPQETLYLFDTLVKPILLYGSDFWGCLPLPKNNPIENLHLMFCKHLLGVHKATTTNGVLLELGRVPLVLFAQKAAVKNWERIRKSKCNPLLDLSYKCAITDNVGGCFWLLNIQKTLERNGLLNFFLNQYMDKPSFINKRLFRVLSDQFHQNAFECIGYENSKLRTYAIFKTEVGIEKYLTHIKNFNYRNQVTKLRLSNHSLRIETGRRNKIPRELRFCPFCPNLVEDESHFLLFCPTYACLRTPLWNIHDEINPMFKFYSSNMKLKYLMMNIDKDLALYITNCFELRKQWMDFIEYLSN